MELVLEEGAAGALLLAASIGSFVSAARRNGRESDPDLRRERLAAGIVVGLLFAHAFVDYPLRMPALAAIFAACAGTLLGARREAAAASGAGLAAARRPARQFSENFTAKFAK